MVPSNFGYSLREAGHHFRRNWSTCLGAVVTIFLSLFIIGIFVFGSALVENVFGSVEDKVTIQAFLSDEAAPEDATSTNIPEDIQKLMDKVSSWENVQSVTFKSKDEAFQEYKQTMSNKNAEAAVAALDGQNPVPASLVIKLHEPQQVADIANKLIGDADYGRVADVNADKGEEVSNAVLYGQGDVEKLFSITQYLRVGAVVLVVLLTFVAFVFINNTIRLAIMARRREIAIERLVGASNGFIRGPFLMEGALESLLGAGLAVAALQGTKTAGLPRLAESLPFLSFNLSDTVVSKTYLGLVLVGLLIGLFGSAIAMRRYLKV